MKKGIKGRKEGERKDEGRERGQKERRGIAILAKNIII